MLGEVEHGAPRLALVASVGMATGALRAAIRFHEPDAVILMASKVTLAPALDVVGEFAAVQVVEVVEVEDVEDLTSCLAAATSALSEAIALRAGARVVDITGGTKPMSLGLALAAAGREVTFSYIGGETRDSLGRVRSGSERLRLLEDPAPHTESSLWEELRAAWNGWRFETARRLARRLIAFSPDGRDRDFLVAFVAVCGAMSAWDRLDHVEALNTLPTPLDTALEAAAQLRQGARVRVLAGLSGLLPSLEVLAHHGASRPTVLAADLVGNALRRTEQGRLEDAAVRLGRAAELLGSSLGPVAEGARGILMGANRGPSRTQVEDALLTLLQRTGVKPIRFGKW